MNDLIERLRALSRYEHSDYSIGDEAADALEAARVDAERYRALRDALLDDESEAWEAFIQQPEPKNAADFDAAIDLARGKGGP